MDFLSFKSIRENEVNNTPDFVILNSLSLFEKARPFLESHKSIKLYLDNDAAGQKVAREALSHSKKYNDHSKLYQNYKDLNDWLAHIGKQQQKRLGNKL